MEVDNLTYQTELDSAVEDPRATHRYHLHTQGDGSIQGLADTNDNLDQGRPTEWAEWPVRYKDYQAMARQSGLSHVGINGCSVEVYLDDHRI
jgi:hypothetical protein